MKKLLFLFLLSGYVFSQTNCELCAEVGGFYCGDDESNWTQYSPLGCVPNGLGGLYYINDGWLDCVDGSDENEAVSTTMADCGAYGEVCDTVYIEIPIIEYIDCASGLPCSSGIGEAIDKSKTNNKMYSLWGYEIIIPRGVYIQNGKIKYKLN